MPPKKKSKAAAAAAAAASCDSDSDVENKAAPSSSSSSEAESPPEKNGASSPSKTPLKGKKPFRKFTKKYIAERRATLQSLWDPEDVDYPDYGADFEGFVEEFEAHEEYYLSKREARLRSESFKDDELFVGGQFPADVFEASLSGALGDQCISLTHGGDRGDPDE